LDEDQIESFEPDPSEEGEDDLHRLTADELSAAVVTATDWTTETILNQVSRGNINLNPRFQRRDAWAPPRKSRFIESVFVGLPIPQLVLAERKDRRNAYLVIDGKQRLLALAEFAAQEGFEPLRLRGLEVRPDLNGKTLPELREDADSESRVAAFDNQPIRTVVVRNWPDEDFLYLVFLRLNTGSVPLSPQELRQALNPGAFIDFLDEFSIESQMLKRVLGLDKPDFRMRDVELLLRYFAFTHFLEDYRGNLKGFLDETCRLLNRRWQEGPEAADELGADAERCEAAIQATFDVFDSAAFRRWSGARFESRFNRAVFDIMVFYFRFDDVAERALARRDRVVDAFKDLCNADEAFRLALQTTTKTIPATAHRLNAWGTALREAVDMDFDVPSLVGELITVR
jgi:hypothetical protein